MYYECLHSPMNFLQHGHLSLIYKSYGEGTLLKGEPQSKDHNFLNIEKEKPVISDSILEIPHMPPISCFELHQLTKINLHLFGCSFVHNSA